MTDQQSNEIFGVTPTGYERNIHQNDPNVMDMDIDNENSSNDLIKNGHLDILNHKFLKINKLYLVEVKKPMVNISDQTVRDCKILKFAMDYNLLEILELMHQSTLSNFRKMFVLIIESNNFGFQSGVTTQLNENIEKLAQLLRINFGTRPFIIQFTSIEEKTSKFIYKHEGASIFNNISLAENVDNFVSFFWKFMNGELDVLTCTSSQTIELLAHQILSYQESSLIMRFLQVYNQLEGFFDILRIKCAEAGSKSQFIAALDDPFDNDGRLLDIKGQELLSVCFSNGTLSSISYSYLSIAADHLNAEVFEYLIDYCTHLIQLLPIDHQIQVTTTAYINHRIEILCILLHNADFPFPQHFDKYSVNHIGLQQIVKYREEFFGAIISENLEHMKNFIDNNMNLKVVYNFENHSALKQALDNNKMNVYCFLKSFGFQLAPNEKNIENSFDETKKLQITNWNAENSPPDEHKSVKLLAVRSFVYNRKITKEIESSYRHKIQQWYEDINNTKYGRQLLNVAAQCEDLKIIFDFESDSVYEVDLLAPNKPEGTAHVYRRWIFIGAKLDNREAVIRGTIAHELCHYALNIVYENNAKPYYKRSKEIAELFEIIFKYYCRWSHALIFAGLEQDDRCDGVIAAVYKCYQSNVLHQELIVRVPHILAQFYLNNVKINELEQMYKFLFVFYAVFVVPDMENFSLKDRVDVRKINRTLGNLQKLETLQILLSASNVPIYEISSQNSIVTTNIPNMLLQDIRNNLIEAEGLLFDSKVIFLSPKALKTKEIMNDLTKILNIYSNSANLNQNLEKNFQCFYNLIINSNSSMNIIIENLVIDTEFKNSLANLMRRLTMNSNNNIIKKFNVIVDCLKESGENLYIIDEIMKIQNINFIFVVSNVNQEIFQINNQLNVNYNWSDLTTQNQKLLVQSKVNFQNFSSISLENLLSDGNMPPNNHINLSDEQNLSISAMSLQEPTISIFTSQYPRNNLIQIPTTSANIFKDNCNDELKMHDTLMDNQLLNLLINKSKILINHSFIEEFNDVKKFNIIFESRDFIKKYCKEERRTLSFEEYEALKIVKKFKNVEKIEKNKLKSGEDRETVKVTEIVQVTKKISINDLLLEVKNQKFVLISDIAGTGKSWMLRKIASILHDKYFDRWITFVDLKQFIDVFNSHHGDFKFASFVAEKIMKPKTDFEQKIFKKLYENGKILILFDGFDEISPDCAKIVTKLLQSFEKNRGNQLWITTRDYFEVDLQEKLEIETVYKLDEFSETNGVDLITSNWVLKELENDANWSNIQHNSEQELKDMIKNSPKYKIFKNYATSLVKKIPKAEFKKIGYPQFYRIVTEIFKDDETGTITFTLYIIYKKYCSKQSKLWSRHQGKIREQAGIAMLDSEMNYSELHQFYAVKKFFPHNLDYCDLKNDNIGWSGAHIIGFGFLSERDGKYVFPHETFCEFYVAEFILRILRKGSWVEYEDFFKYFLHFLTINTFNVVRMFINEGWNENSIPSKIDNKIQKFADKFDQEVNGDEDFYLIFGENLENLVEFFIKIFSKLNYSKVKKIIFKNIEYILDETENSNTYEKIQNFYLDFLSVDNLKFLIEKRFIIHKTVNSSLDSDVFDQLIKKLEIKINKNYIKDNLISTCNNLNILAMIVLNDHSKFQNFSVVLEIFQKYLSTSEIWEMICNKGQINILHMVMLSNDAEKLKVIWQAIEIFCKIHNESFCDLLKPTLNFNKNRTPLFDAVFRNNIEFHKTLWELLKLAFENKGKLKEYILKIDDNGNNCLHMLVSYGDPNIIEITFEILEDYFDYSQYKEIIESKGYANRNLLQKAADISTNIETHRILWKIIHNFCSSNEIFLNFLKQIDDSDSNVIFIAANFSSSLIVKFMIESLEFASPGEIKNLLDQKTSYKRNLLQSAISLNKSYEMHSYLWKIVRKYFDQGENYNMVTEIDNTRLNLLELAHKFNTPIKEFTWNEIINVIPPEEQDEYLRNCYFNRITYFNF